MNHTLFFKINPSIKFPAWDSDSHYKFLFSKNLFKTKRSYERWLEKGFVVIKSTDSKLIKNINTLKNYKDVVLKFVDGKAKAKITNYEEK